MTISKKAISDFLNRELDDWAFLKQWKRKDLLDELRELEVRPRITSPFKHWHHQLVSLLLCCLHDSFLLFLDLGSGKTRILLETFAYKRRLGRADCMFVVCINDVNAYGWEDDAAIHAPQFKVQVLTGSKGKRWADFEEIDADIYVTSYAGMRTMLCKRVPNKKGGNREMPDTKLITLLCKYVNFVAYDEIHKCKNPKSVTYQIARHISKRVPFRYGATGTAFGTNPEDLWAQFFLIDLGETLSTTLGMFREAFFLEKEGWFATKYVFDPRTRGIFRKALRNRSIYYRDSEIGDMPKRIRNPILLRPPVSLQEYYNKGLESLQTAARQDDLENNWVRLRMICSGFVSYKGEDDGKIEIELPDNPKIESLQSFIEMVPLDKKAIIVHEFVYSGLMIERTLKEMGIPFLYLNGRQKDKKKTYRDFTLHHKTPRFLVMNWRSGGTGGNYQIAPYMHTYEPIVSPIEAKQTEGRIRRRSSGGKHRVHYSYSIIKGSVEEDILDNLKAGRNLYKTIMQEKGKRLKKLRAL